MLAGWDFQPMGSIHVIPNIEFVKYDDVNGAAVKSDIVPRVTFYFVWP